MLAVVSLAAAQLAASPHAPTSDTLRHVDHATIYVPEKFSGGLLVMLHGAGGEAEQSIRFMKTQADERGFIIIAPKSEAASWDIISRRAYGPDVTTIDLALGAVFDRYRVDPARVAIGGFSDGASYALSLGLTNGHLFKTILAFSPGFESAPSRKGAPRIFISHGADDRVLAVDRCSRRLVQRLKNVEYYEFDGGHAVPAGAIERAMKHWY